MMWSMIGKPEASVARPSNNDGEARSGLGASAGASAKVGRLAADSVPGALVVDFEGNTLGPLAARSVVTLDAAALGQAIALRQLVVLLFENGDPRLPIIVGLVPVDPGAALLGQLLAPVPPTLASPPAPVAAPARPVEARVDGRRILLEGQEEVVLRCGEASITLKRDGKLILRGAYVETHAKGVNRIKGGSVKIN
jgi:hypothetical protein